MGRAGKSGVLFALAAATIWASSHANAGEVLDRITRSGTIVLTNRDASVPFSYLDEDKKPVGYAVDVCIRLVDAIRRNMNRPDLKVAFYPVTSASRIPSIVAGKADLECGSTTNNAERRKLVSFTIPYFITGARMIVKADSGIKSWADLRGKTIVTTRGTTNADSIRRRNDVRALNIRLIEADDHGVSFAMVESGKADAFAMDDVLLYGLRAHAGNPREFSVVGSPLTIEPYAVMFSRSDPELKKMIDLEMADLIHRGELHKLYEKWFQRPIEPKGVNLEMPMSHLLRTSLRFPSDKVAD